jgi:site-specific DNA-methyltransferase (adenine-specific)
MTEPTTAALPVTTTLPIEEIKPYWRNPRRIPPEAVAAVAKSIEDYGYQQPIVVDLENVVIVGHTRLAALKSLGFTHVPVYVSDLPEDKAREYRLVDNRTSEMSSWDHTALVMELREWEQGLLSAYFPDIDLEIDQINSAMDVTQKDVDDATAKMLEVHGTGKVMTTQVVCPACFHTFEVRTDSLPGLSHQDMAELEALSEHGASE